MINSDFPGEVDYKTSLTPSNTATNITIGIDVIRSNDAKIDYLISVETFWLSCDYIKRIASPIERFDRIGQSWCSSSRLNHEIDRV